MIEMTHKSPWYSPRRYNSHIIIVDVLHQDTNDRTMHETAISNHNALKIVKVLRLTRNKYALMVLRDGQKYIYYYRMNRRKEPLLSKKISLLTNNVRRVFHLL